MMEGVLERAVQLGIDSFRRQLSAVMPDDMLLVTGDAPAARGFRLDGYGVFFDVEVPGVRPSLAWSLRTMNETASMFARELSQVRAQLRQAVNDPRQRQEMDRVLARIQAQMAPGSQAPPQPAAGDGRVSAGHRHRAITRRGAGVLRPVGSLGRRRGHRVRVARCSASPGSASTLDRARSLRRRSPARSSTPCWRTAGPSSLLPMNG